MTIGSKLIPIINVSEMNEAPEPYQNKEKQPKGINRYLIAAFLRSFVAR